VLRYDTTKLRSYPVLKWGERDLPLMTRIIGAEEAVKMRAPYNCAIVKAAQNKGMVIHTRVLKQLDADSIVRDIAKELQKLKSAPGNKAFFPHQRADIHYLVDMSLPAYLLGHQPGVGKTLVAMSWAIRNAINTKRILVVAPNSAKTQWAREIRRWLGNDQVIHIVEGTKADQRRIARRSSGWIIGHWESLVTAEEGYLRRPWDVVILDEAHNIKNRDAIRTQVVQHLEARKRIALTAHPYTNGPDELWSILHFLYPEQYSSYWRFFHQHIKAIPRPFGGYEIIGVRNPKLLKWEISPFVLRRLKKDVFKSLPPIVRDFRWAHLTKRGI